MTYMAPGSAFSISRAWTSAILPSEICRKLGILPRKSNSVCIFTADLVVRKCAHGKTDRHRSMVVECQFQAKIFSGIELPSLDDQPPGQFRIDPPIPGL